MKTATCASEALSSQDKKQLSTFLVLSHFYAPALEKKLRAEADQLQVKIVIDSKLIDEVIAEELANDRKAQEAVLRGREQISAREAI